MIKQVGSVSQSESPDNLINGTFPQVTTDVTIKYEGYLKRGSVLGKILEGEDRGKFTLSKLGSIDGSDKPCCILLDDYKPKSNKKAVVYLTGQFNSRSVILGEGLQIDEVTEDLR